MTAYILNLLDLLFTLHALSHGGVEMNPFLQSVPFMIFYKVVILGAVLGWLSSRKEKIAHFGLRIATAAFAAVNVWHIGNLFIIYGGVFP